MYKATQDQVDNVQYKAYNRTTTNRLIVREQAAAPLKQAAEFYLPTIPTEPGPPDDPTVPIATQTLLLNFDQELKDRSSSKNDALFEFTNNQLLFIAGQGAQMNFAVNFNPSSNSSYDKIWVPFSNSTQMVYDTPSGFSIFTRIMPSTLTNLGTQAVVAPAPMTGRVQYQGGPAYTAVNPTMHVIWWGSGWNSGSPESFKNTIKTDFANLLASQYFNSLWQYGGTKKPASIIHVDNTSFSIPGPTALTFTDMVNCIRNSQTTGLVPNPDNFMNANAADPAFPWMDLHHVFFLMIPPNKTLPPGYGGAHSSAGTGVSTNTYAWGSVGYNTTHDPSLGASDAEDNAFQGITHELIDLLSDPFPSGTQGTGAYSIPDCQNGVPGSVFSGRCEIAQICGHIQKRISSAWVEAYYSDMDGKCVVPGVDNYVHEPTATTGTTIRRYIFQKMDDLDNGATAALGSDGTVYFSVKKAGVEYRRQTASGSVNTNAWCDLWFTFNYSTNTPAIYVNNVKYTTTSTEGLLWNNTHSHMIIGNYNLGPSIGQYRGKMDEFRLYRNTIVSDAQVDNLNTNGLTITDINVDETQGVAIVNRCKIDTPLATDVYEPDDVELDDVP